MTISRARASSGLDLLGQPIWRGNETLSPASFPVALTPLIFTHQPSQTGCSSTCLPQLQPLPTQLAAFCFFSPPPPPSALSLYSYAYASKTITHLFSKIPYVHFSLKFTLLWAVPVESKVNISSPKLGLSPERLQSGSCLLPQFLCLLQKQKTEYENQAVRRLTVFYSWSIYSQFNCIFNANYNTLIFN